MQLMWMSGPTSKVVTWSIDRRTIILGVLGLAVGLVLLGGGLQMLGIRIAVDSHPHLARALGGVTSAAEQARVEQRYEQRIAELQQQLQSLSGKVDQLEAAKRAIVQLVPAPLPPAREPGARGGPFRRLVGLDWFAPRADDHLDRTQGQIRTLDQRVSQLHAAWQTEQALLRQLPLQRPLQEAQQTSDFGPRLDPFNGRHGLHEGVDFVAPYGSPVLATAPGTVVQAERHADYGLTVDVDHGQGFSTRYAHASRLEVRKGDTVQAGQVIARLGNTGRSTGPHLHYEVRLHGQAIRPLADNVLQQAALLPIPSKEP